MWEDWKKAWQEAVSNFERELNSDDDDFASPALRASAMRRDLKAASDALNRLRADLAQAESDFATETEAEQTARRRAEQAQRINDEDTARIANEFAQRHTLRAGVLQRKVDVLKEELAMREEEFAEMEQQAQEELAGIPEPPDAIERDKQDFNFRKMERERKEKEAEARLEELKKKMQ
jgi:hypothetical protein